MCSSSVKLSFCYRGCLSQKPRRVEENYFSSSAVASRSTKEDQEKLYSLCIQQAGDKGLEVETGSDHLPLLPHVFPY